MYGGWFVSSVRVPRLQRCTEDIANTRLGVDLTAWNATQGMKSPLWSWSCNRGERVDGYLNSHAILLSRQKQSPRKGLNMQLLASCYTGLNNLLFKRKHQCAVGMFITCSQKQNWLYHQNIEISRRICVPGDKDEGNVHSSCCSTRAWRERRNY